MQHTNCGDVRIAFLISSLLFISFCSFLLLNSFCHYKLTAPHTRTVLPASFTCLIGRSSMWHSVQHQSSPVGLGFKPALSPSPTWSSGWVLLGCWLTSAERWSDGKPGVAPARESGPVHRPWWGRGPGAGRCWQVEARAVLGHGVGSIGRELDRTIVRYRQQWGRSGWTGEVGVEEEWRRQGGGTGSPCGQPER